MIAAEREQWRRERNEHEIREHQEHEAIAAEREQWRKERADHAIRERHERKAIEAERESNGEKSVPIMKIGNVRKRRKKGP